MQGDVIGVGYRPRTGSLFFTRNGKKLDDVAHGLKSQNFFPTVGANGPCTVHVNFGQSGFVFIEANVKKWGLAPITGSLAPPPPYGSEQGSILLEAGREGARQGQIPGPLLEHSRSRSANVRITQPTSPGPERSPTEISLAQLAHIPSNEDVGEGTSRSAERPPSHHRMPGISPHPPQDFSAPPPDYTSPEGSMLERSRRGSESGVEDSDGDWDENVDTTPLVGSGGQYATAPIPNYDAAVASANGTRDDTNIR